MTLDDVECLKYSLSKGLGVGIVAGGSIMKIPQLLTSALVPYDLWSQALSPLYITVISSGSAAGLSLSAYILETLSYAVTLAYSVQNNFPFSTYGENLFLTAQNAIITLLIAALPSSSKLSSQRTSPLKYIFPLLLGGAGTAYALYTASPNTLALAQLATLPLGVASKLPQIAQNRRARSTGQLSGFAVISQTLGSLARLFTTLSEVGDTRLAAGFVLAFALNCVLAVQLFAYRGARVSVPVPIDVRKEEKEGSVLGDKVPGATGEVRWGAEAPGKPSIPRIGSPIPRYGSPQPGRRWSRKVD